MKKTLLVLFTLICVKGVYAQTEKVTELQPVVVTATRGEIQLENSPIPTEVIGKDEIEKLNLNTMDDLLKQKGFFVAPPKSGGFQLRGLSSEYVLVMIDGVPVAGRQSGALDLSNIYLGNVERVEIVKGSMSSLWGNHAIGGVVNIITKKGGENSTTISSQYGTNNESLTGITSTFGKKKLKNVSQLSYGFSDGFDIDETLPGKNVLPFKQLNVSNKFSYLVNPNDLVSLSVNYLNRQSNGSTITETNTQGQLVPVVEDNLSENLILDFTYDAWLSEKFNSQLKISNSHFNNSNQSTFNYFGQDVTQLDESNQNIFQPEIINTYYWNGNQQTTFGGGYTSHTYNTERYGGNKSLNSYFGYFQHYINLKKLNVVAGGRYDNYSDFGTNFSPKISATYNVGKLKFSSSVGYGFRVPDFRTLYINYGGYSQGFYVLGAYNIEEQIQFYQSQNQLPVVFYPLNDITNLNPETSISYDFGVSYKLNNKSKVGINLFQTNTTDLIESVLAGVFVNQTLLFGYTNISEATFRGVEVSETYQLKNFRLDASYQYLETQANKADGTEFFLGERPKHLGNLSATYTHPKSKVSFNVNGVVKSEYFFRDVNRNGLQDDNEFVPGHTLLNTFVNKQIKNFNVGFGANNILNFTNPTYLKFQNGRTIFGKLTYRL